ncbi:MBL fold metallo-hydrolase [Elizabethkingia anophelis]|jgi:glyoxylase-like metal-dependent hydrolase (beta-lactamase superfamily II)/rhodanese-related sulfurtransferase|uniref:Glyoxylase-like metal-dependent hydrolase (Beta-lactamase superfamily II) n=2 Tax=Bacteroidota TaxID=976 RepID=A0A318UGA4_9SPHI|nr:MULTISPECIES: MBL fold metallo-hydrolase [Bacteroidota]MBN9299135.1 MBL fold metallo-hydrolase [Filimonas sp.]MDV2466295.1 MBL fold metallo-hydrolase [Elizabethkingia anophelis]OJV56460.1 MAG: MBL fold metallo-hydrolase [Bacteroidetes bacterium 43-16]MDV3725000.1 MBL fold metallo-hydrolase [Elizabethkingia anophelis]MDV3730521.1 MBL fold metallo-hydrolase [Elizabethkingia anophelis]
MKIEQIYTGCLAQGAYYITSNGEAAIIDPLRETQPYLDRLEKDDVKLKYIFETHFHADFVSGHVDLSKKTNASIVYGPTAKPEFEAIVAEDNQIFELGNVKIKVLHTPGHTMESSCFLLIDENGNETALFSGDTLFLGDVGRPDLAQKAANLTQEELAGLLYDSLYHKILPLSDDITVYPAHGAGSACGKNMMKETVDSLGNQKSINYALNQPDKESFIKAVTDGLLPPPAYFGMNVAMNKKGYDSFEEVLSHGMKALSAEEFEAAAENTGALILDTRSDKDFAKGFIPKSINIGLKGDFAPWVGAMIVDVKQPILLVTDNGTEEEAVTRLSRVGFDNVLGHLKDGFETWIKAAKETDIINRITADQFSKDYYDNSKVIDVRKESEYTAEHVEDAYSKPLAYINDWVKELNPKEHFYLHCAGGYRSMIAASILQARGYRNFTEVEGGFNAIAQTSIPKTDFVCQSKMLS